MVQQTLVQELEPKLNETRIPLGAGCSAENPTCGTGVGSSEVRMVKAVEELSPELNAESFLDARILVQRKVPVLQAITPHQIGSSIAQGRD